MPEPAYYYLHTNGALIYKRFRPDPSDFVRRIWTVNLEDRGSAYLMLIEAGALGADMRRVLDLAAQWKMDGDDGLQFCERAGFVATPTDNEAGRGYSVRHKDDAPERTDGEGSSPLLALISYVRQGDFARAG